jgi:hypothetical protein
MYKGGITWKQSLELRKRKERREKIMEQVKFWGLMACIFVVLLFTGTNAM